MSNAFDSKIAARRLKEALGPSATFRDGQLDALRAVSAPGARLLLVQSTGWGKSVVYFLAAKLGQTPTLIISPLIALMRNQVEMARRFGLNAHAMHSGNRDEWDTIVREAELGRVDALLVSPERLQNPEFRQQILHGLLPRLKLVVVDEAHCMSEWGHDFRPEYRSAIRHVAGLSSDAAILAATATVTEPVLHDLQKHFGPFLEIQRGKLVRTSLRLVAVEIDRLAERLAWLAKYLPKLPGSGIVYTLTVFDAKEVARWLRRQGIEADAYYAELENEERVELETAFCKNRVKALVATTALGMGYDKADVGFVVHYQVPSSLIGYYQQIGRAGRAMDRAYAILLAGREDQPIVESFINSARPPDWVFEELVRACGRAPKPFDELARRIAVSGSMVRHALEILESGEAAWRDSAGMYHIDPIVAMREISLGAEIRARRQAELAQMFDYIRSSRCRMQSVAEALGDAGVEPCGICDRCKPVDPVRLDPAKIAEADRFLHGEPKILVPRANLPMPVLDGKRQIPLEWRNLPGPVLGFYGDEGWGKLVKEGKYDVGRYAESLVEAAAEAVRSSSFEPSWLAWIPGSRSGAFAEFAVKLAARIGVPAIQAVQKKKPMPPQKSMTTREEQFWNVWSSFEVTDVPSGPCLLADDIVDSGWTLTVVGLLLRRAGSGPVLPLALAAASSSRLQFRDEAGSL